MSNAEEDAPTKAEVDEELHACARFGEIDDLKVMVEGEDTKPLFDVNALDASKNSALHKAAANGHLDMLKYLVSLKADYMLNENGIGPLSWAILNKHTEVVRYLLTTFDTKIDVLAKPKVGRSILSESYDSEVPEISSAILEHSSAKELDDRPKGADALLGPEKKTGGSGNAGSRQETKAEATQECSTGEPEGENDGKEEDQEEEEEEEDDQGDASKAAEAAAEKNTEATRGVVGSASAQSKDSTQSLS